MSAAFVPGEADPKLAVEVEARQAADTALDARVDAVESDQAAETAARIAAVDAVLASALTAIGVAVGAHEADTTNVHGISDTSRLITQDNIAAYAPAPDLTPYVKTDGSRAFTGPVALAGITGNVVATGNVQGAFGNFGPSSEKGISFQGSFGGAIDGRLYRSAAAQLVALSGAPSGSSPAHVLDTANALGTGEMPVQPEEIARVHSRARLDARSHDRRPAGVDRGQQSARRRVPVAIGTPAIFATTFPTAASGASTSGAAALAGLNPTCSPPAMTGSSPGKR